MGAKTISLGQVFYGHGAGGYRVLGASRSGLPFAEEVSLACRAFGSPDRPGDVRPFLATVRRGENVMMIRVQGGERDSSARVTLFSHALVARADALAAAGLDAFALADMGAFASSLPEDFGSDLTVPLGEASLDPSPDGVTQSPVFISADCPQDELVRRALAGRTLSTSWSTYSYRPLEGFGMCVLSPCAGMPRSVPEAIDREPAGEGASIALKASLLLNLFLAAAAGILFFMPPSPSSPDTVDIGAVPASEVKWKAEARKTLEDRLASAGGFRLTDFDSLAIESIPYFRQVLKQPDGNAARLFYDSCKAYAEFVEQVLFGSIDKIKEHRPYENKE